MWNELTFSAAFLWNELTILWNDLAIGWNDLTMERNDRIPYISFGHKLTLKKSLPALDVAF